MIASWFAARSTASLPSEQPELHRLISASRRAEVLRDQFGVLCGRFGEAARERLADPFVQRAPRLLEQRLIRGVADERVLEEVRLLQ